MRIILLLAGSGTRLRPFTNNIPKCLVEIDGTSLLNRQLEIINSLGLNDIIAVTGYKEAKLKNFQFTQKIVNLRYSETNMLYSLFCARKYFDEDIIVSYGDIVYAPSVLKEIMNSQGDIVVAADSNWKSYWEQRSENPIGDLETFSINSFGHIDDIGRPVDSYHGINGQYIGLIKISKKCLSFLTSSIDNGGEKAKVFSGRCAEDAYITDFIRAAIQNDYVAKPVLFKEPWVEVDTVEDMLSPFTQERLSIIRDSLNFSIND